jgi:hypothetical protein
MYQVSFFRHPCDSRLRKFKALTSKFAVGCDPETVLRSVPSTFCSPMPLASQLTAFQLCAFLVFLLQLIKQTPCPDSASELYRPSDLRLSAKLVPSLANIGVVAWSTRRIHMAVFSVFLTGAATFSSK